MLGVRGLLMLGVVIFHGCVEGAWSADAGYGCGLYMCGGRWFGDDDDSDDHGRFVSLYSSFTHI